MLNILPSKFLYKLLIKQSIECHLKKLSNQITEKISIESKTDIKSRLITYQTNSIPAPLVCRLLSYQLVWLVVFINETENCVQFNVLLK